MSNLLQAITVSGSLQTLRPAAIRDLSRSTGCFEISDLPFNFAAMTISIFHGALLQKRTQYSQLSRELDLKVRCTGFSYDRKTFVFHSIIHRLIIFYEYITVLFELQATDITVLSERFTL